MPSSAAAPVGLRAGVFRVIGVLLVLAPSARPAAAQAADPASFFHEFTIHAEPVAVGGRYAYGSGPLRVGPSVSIGPFEGVTLRRGISGQLKEWATSYATVSYAPIAQMELVLSPIGAVLALGDDFSSVYPSAQLGIQVGGGRWLIGSDVRVIRIAGGDGTGLYWVQWVPARVGLRWRW